MAQGLNSGAHKGQEEEKKSAKALGRHNKECKKENQEQVSLSPGILRKFMILM